MNKPTFKHICLMHIQQLTNFPYIEKDFDALTDYGLLCKVVDYLNQVIASENAQNDNILALYNAFIELKTYVENFFDNLDVQDEINNKLNEMAEDGTLDQIIEQYLNSSAIWGFDTVADMKNATNLINGSYAKTLGYYAKDDGGSALYKVRTITNNDDVDEANIIALYDNSLVAELIKDEGVNVKQYGAYGDNTHDDTSAIQNALNSNKNVFIPKGIYNVTYITLNQYQFLHGEGRTSVINSTQDNTNNDIFAIVIPASADRIIVKDLRVNGGIDNATTGTATEQDVNNTFENISILGGYGFKVHHRGNYLNNIRCGSTKYGIDVSGTDNVIDSCIAAVTDSHGFYIEGANNTVTNSKSFIAGNTSYGNGFCIVGAFTRLSNCEAQQNKYENYWVQNSYGTIIQNCISDGAFWGKSNISSYTSPVFNTSIPTSAIFLHNLNSCVIDIANINGSSFGTLATTHEVLGIHYPATIHKCSINISSYNRDNHSNILHDKDLFRYVSNNSIILNGINFNSFINGKNLIVKEITGNYTAGQTQTFYTLPLPTDTTKVAINFDKVNGDTTKFTTIVWDILVVNVKDGNTNYSASSYNYYTENTNGYVDLKKFIDSLEADSIKTIEIRFRGTAKANQDPFVFTLNNVHIATSNSLISDTL